MGNITFDTSRVVTGTFARGALVSPSLLLVFFLLVKLKLCKGAGSFKQYASLIGYSYAISLLYLLISLPVSFITGELYLDSSLANLTNIFAPELQGSYLYGLIRGIDYSFANLELAKE